MNKKLQGLESFDSGSNYRFGDKMQSPNCPRSLFDLSHLNSLTIPNAGLMVPITYWETLPGDDFDISIDTLLRVMPQVVPLYSRQRLYVYGFYSPYSTLWNNWQVFMDKGYTGNVNKTIPTLNRNNLGVSDYSASHTIAPDTLHDYMGLPIGANGSKLFDSNSSGGYAHISALPYMMYLRIYRDYFCNKNHYINDRLLLPDDDSRFRLNDNGQLLSALDEGKTFGFSDNMYGYNAYSSSSYFGLFYHDFPDDYFTSALPFTQRGTATPLSAAATGLSASTILDFSNVHLFKTGNSDITGQIPIYSTNYSTLTNLPPFQVGQNGVDNTSIDSQIYNQLNKTTASTTINGNASLNIFLEDIRKLAIQQQELERLARTDGSYLEFGLSFFGEKPRNAYDYRPIYIGGTYKNLAFTEVLQTSASTVQGAQPQGSTTNSPLGAYAGHGITGIQNGRIGHIHCDDYGLIMLIACVMPDVYYSQGLDRVLTDSLQSDKYLPERALLGMQPILNKELYYAGNNGNSIGQDNYVWAYQNPFDWLRYIPNKIHGKIADSTNNSFFPYTQSRKFTSLPNWGPLFANASLSNVRKDYLAAPSEDAYSAQFKFNIRAVRPLPYKATPAQIVHY